MLEGIFGNRTAEKILLYLLVYEEGYASAIADTFEDVSLSMAQNQLERFERASALVSRRLGRTRVFTWNPRFPFLAELRALIAKELEYLPRDQRERYFQQRRRPRRTGKPR
jgi:hypothetical protein